MFITVKYTSTYSGKEFPPSPWKLLCSLIAGTKGEEKYFPALKLLQSQVPTIYATEPDGQFGYGNYVPDNDHFGVDHIHSGYKKQLIRMFEDGIVAYEYDVPPELQSLLAEAVSRVNTLGRAGDWCVASLRDALPTAKCNKYTPAPGGSTILRAPNSQSLPSILAHYKNKNVAEHYKTVTYEKNARTPRTTFELTEPVRAEQISHVVARIRHAAMKRGIPAISGHDDGERLQIVPLVTLDWNDNMVHRVVVTSRDPKLVRIAATRMAGMHLTDDTGKDCGYLVPAESNAVFSDYLSPSKTWTSVTPVIQLFHNRKPQKREKIFRKMIVEAGLPMPISVCEFPLYGEFEINAKHRHDRYPRAMYTLEFAEEVPGIVALGMGRFTGLGIFANRNRFTTTNRFAEHQHEGRREAALIATI